MALDGQLHARCAAGREPAVLFARQLDHVSLGFALYASTRVGTFEVFGRQQDRTDVIVLYQSPDLISDDGRVEAH